MDGHVTIHSVPFHVYPLGHVRVEDAPGKAQPPVLQGFPRLHVPLTGILSGHLFPVGSGPAVFRVRATVIEHACAVALPTGFAGKVTARDW